MTDPADGDRLPAVSRTSSILRATGAGVGSGAVGIAVSELVAGVIPGAPSLVVAVGSFVIAKQPAGAKDLVATLFGTNDKLALNIAVVVVALLVAAVLRTRLP
jgi:tetrahydromethanopterin S-methyltransferase subunit D